MHLEHMKSEVKCLAELINESDPTGLIEQGAPDCEYAGEAFEMMAALVREGFTDVQGVQRIIKGVFGHSFEELFHEEEPVWEKLAESIANHPSFECYRRDPKHGRPSKS